MREGFQSCPLMRATLRQNKIAGNMSGLIIGGPRSMGRAAAREVAGRSPPSMILSLCALSPLKRVHFKHYDLPILN